MPTLSTFFGIVIKMYYDDHNPPHFHAEYGEHELVVGINPIRVLAGEAPHRVRSLVFEWAAMHQQELHEDWNLCKTLEAPKPIDPLD